MGERLARLARFRLRGIGVIAGLLVSGAVVWNSSGAVFTDTTTNPGNDWSAGHVTLDDNRSGTAMFDNIGPLKPGSTSSACIEVAYTGNLASNIYLYAANYSNTGGTDMGGALTLTVEVGSGGTCAVPGTYTQVFSSSIATFGAKTTYATGYLSHAVTGAATRPFNVTYLMGDNNAAQSESVSIDLVWEARNT